MRRAASSKCWHHHSSPEALTCVVWSLIFDRSTIINFRYWDQSYATLTMSPMMMGRCLQVTSGSSQSQLSSSLSLSGRPLFPGRRYRRRGCRDLQRSLSLGSERPGPAWGRQLRGDTRRGQTSDIRTSDVNIQPGARAASEVSSSEQEKPVYKLCAWVLVPSFWIIRVLLWTLSIIQREIRISWTSCLLGNDESCWHKSCYGEPMGQDWDLKFKNDVWGINAGSN